MVDRRPASSGPPPLVPRGLRHDEAAAYCGLTVPAFDAEVAAGRLPGPVFPDRRPRVWDRLALERAFDSLSKTSKSSTSPFIERLRHGAGNAASR